MHGDELSQADESKLYHHFEMTLHADQYGERPPAGSALRTRCSRMADPALKVPRKVLFSVEASVRLGSKLGGLTGLGGSTGARRPRRFNQAARRRIPSLSRSVRAPHAPWRLGLCPAYSKHSARTRHPPQWHELDRDRQGSLGRRSGCPCPDRAAGSRHSKTFMDPR